MGWLLSLVQFQTDDQSLRLMQNSWASALNPIISNALVNNGFLQGQIPSDKNLGIALINGTTIINHKLGRALQGWIVVRNNAAATIYDAQATNLTPELTLVLVSSAACTVSLVVF